MFGVLVTVDGSAVVDSVNAEHSKDIKSQELSSSPENCGGEYVK